MNAHSVLLTTDEAHRIREGAVERRKTASAAVDSMSRTIADVDVRFAALGRAGDGSTCAEAMADELIALRAAEHEAKADWHEARQLCGLKAAR